MAWIIKIDPMKSGFRLADCLAVAPKHGGRLALTPVEHVRDLKCNDDVYLWQLGARSGLCAKATVIGPTEARPQPEWQQYFGSPTNYDPAALRVLLQLQCHTSEPVTLDFDGIVLWKPNAGTTQRCPSPKCPPETLARFDAMATTFTSISPPSVDEYQQLLKLARGRAETDRPVQALARVEQAYWRKMLFGHSRDGLCAICGRYLPVELLVAAHIKPRSNCSDCERLDPENVMVACLLGCDALFEKGYIRVDNGTVQSSGIDADVALTSAIAAVHGRLVCLGSYKWTTNRAQYFSARRGQ